MKYLEEKRSNISLLIENQFPSFVQQNNSGFIRFLESYYESLENQYQPLDIASNLIDYYNVGYYRKNQLVEKTSLSSNLLSTDTSITVESTVGFPSNNGYIQIDDEIIFYREKSSTQFLDCVRGTKALVLKNIPKSEVILVDSESGEHKSGSHVYNIAYTYAIEFFRRIKSEIAPLIPEKVSDGLDISSFLKQIKSFYSAKGSLNGHRILFKILFNDRRFRLYLKSRGIGAEIKVNNYNGEIPANPPPTIISGGEGYDNRIDTTTNEFLNSPVIDVLGSGTGKITQQGLRPNKTAIVKVTGINSNGSITSIEVTDEGDGYVGPINARVRPRSFFQDQRVYNSSKTGFGRVDYWDGFTNELVLYDVVGYFKSDDEIITDDREKARAFVSRIFVGTTSIKDGVEIIPETQNIEFPRDYTFKTSDSKYNSNIILKLKLLSGIIPDKFQVLPTAYNLRQDSDPVFGIPGVDIEIDNFTQLIDDVSEYEIGTNSDIANIYLPASTELVVNVSNISSSYVDSNGSDKFVITVDDASKFPVANGILYVNGHEIEYKSRSHNQFFECSYSGSDTFNISIGDKVLDWGRKKYDVEWVTNQTVTEGEFRFYGENLYKSVNGGVTGSVPPNHTSGIVSDGSFSAGDQDPVSWRYVSSNIYKHYFYIKSTTQDPDAKFEVLALPGDIVIVDGGSLHTKQEYEFSDLESPNTQMYNFTTSEISDRLAVLLSSNFNRNYLSVTDKNLPSYKSLIGFNTQYDYGDYIYVPTTTIPKWWSSIVDLTQPISVEDQKKVAFTNQKVLSRWKKSGLIYETQAIGIKEPTRQSIGLNVDAVQLNSFRGNTIQYGKIDKFVIGDGGSYQIPFKSNGYDIDNDRLPTLILRQDSTEEVIPASSGDIAVSGKITNIDYDKLYSLWGSTNLTGFSFKPSIQVINRNPNKRAQINKTQIDSTTDILTVTYQSSESFQIFDTTDKVKFIGSFSLVSPIGSKVDGLMVNLEENQTYFVRKVSSSTTGSTTTVEYSLFETETDCLLNTNKISLDYLTSITNFEIIFETGNLNPIDFEPADIDISYNQVTGSIDNFIILNSGKGYIEAPIIRLSGGGKLDDTGVDIPYEINGVKIVEMQGSLISKENFYKSNYFEFSNTYSNTIFEVSPRVSVDYGSGAEASVYVANGKIVSVILISQGSNYFTKPTINLYGVGKNGVIEAKIDNTGHIIGFDIINQGEGYTQPPRLEIVPSGSGAFISCLLKEWTFNLVHRLNQSNRIDSYGGYVYHEDDSSEVKNLSNPRGFRQIDSKLNLPPSEDNKQYLLMQSSDKLLADYTRTQRNGFLVHLYPNRDLTTNPLTDVEALTSQVHSPAISVSYDGIPIYGKRAHSVRWQSSSAIVELKSRYKLKYSLTQTPGSVEKIINGTPYYFNRDGGPSISEYPLGSFVEDYEFVAGTADDLDIHNGRFCVTPEFPTGRYCYFSTTQSFDQGTNEIITDSGISFAGYPYFIGPTYASIPDNYTNKSCRTSDKIPKNFTRAFEKEIPAIEIPDYFTFPGLPSNKRYPRELKNHGRAITRSSALTTGSVDSVIIESKGTNYSVGDKLIVDNIYTDGSGFSAFVSKISGKNILQLSQSSSNTQVTVTTENPHGLSIGDYVYFDYKPTSNIILTLHDYTINGLSIPVSDKVNPAVEFSILTDPTAIDKFKDKKLYTIQLNSKFVYEFNIPPLDYIMTYDIDRVNEHFILPRGNDTDKIIIDAKLINSILYLHIGDYIYEISTSDQYSGEYRVLSIDNQNNKFTFDAKVDTSLYEVDTLYYDAKSTGATGSIEEISISNPGSNYTKLPEITGIETTTGTGALIQANSSTIGKIRNVQYISAGGGFTSNQNVNHYLNLPPTAKVTNNFEIYEVEIVDGGFEYNDVLTVKVNGSTTKANIVATAQLGTITSIEVIDGGANFSSIPTITVESTTGYGAIFKAKMRRKQLFPGNSIQRDFIPTSLFPVDVNGTVVNFDQSNSTIEFDEFTGQFQENDLVYTSDGKPYGNLVSIRRSKAYAKVSPYINMTSSRFDISGNTSEFLQRITDSNLYQDWSYMISTSRDTKEWKDDVLTNTHPAGHKAFGKKFIERRKFFFDSPADVFKSSVIFTTNLVNQVELNLKLTPCKKQNLLLINVDEFFVGDYIYGTISGAIGNIVEISENSIEVENRNEIDFKVGEVVIKVSPLFAFGIQSITDKFLGFWEGIFQEPDVSYEASPFDTNYNILSDVFIPKFALGDGEVISLVKLTNSYDYLDSTTLNSTSNSFSLTKDGNTYDITQSNIGEFIFSIGGSVQNPNNFTVSQNIVQLNDTVNYDDTRVFGVRQQNLKVLTFTGNNIGTTFTLNYTPVAACNLLIFYDGVSQSHLLTDWNLTGNTITFSETVDKSNIFGWYIDEDVTCYLFDSQDFLKYKILGTRGCTTKNFTQFIHSSAVKHPTSFYEIRKESLDGTVYADSDNVTVYGFDTKFTYTSPKYSKSYVEALDPIQFNGSQKTFTLKLLGDPYTPKNGEKSTIVYVNNTVLDPDNYSIVNNTITFVNTYSSSDKCMVADFVSNYKSNVTQQNCEILDRLNVVQNGTRKTFNMSNNGVPFYARNPGDVFVLKNDKLKRPELRSYKQKQDSDTESIVENKFTFVTPPLASDSMDLVYFNRQLAPEPTKNVILDDFRCFDGIRTEFPLTLDGKLYYPQYTKNLFVVRNGVFQKPQIDYYISDANLVFTTAPVKGEVVFTYYSFDGLNQNIFIDTFKMFDGIQSDFALTRNYISSYLDNNYDIMVYRNGVYQHADVDYTVLNKQTGPYIRFFTAPVPSDEIYIVNFNLSNNDDLVDVTSRFSQVNSTTIQYTDATPSIDDDLFLIYINGLLQVNDGSWQYNNLTNQILFSGSVDLLSDKISIFAFKNKKRTFKTIDIVPLDSFKKFDGVHTRFSLTNNYIESNVLDEINLQVYRNGVYQYPDVDYTISDSDNDEFIVGQNTAKTIEFTTAPVVGDEIFINNITTNDIIDVTSRFSQLSANSLHYSEDLQNPIDETLFLIYKNGTLQDSGSWSYSLDILTFSENISLTTDNLKIYAFRTQKKILDSINIKKIDQFRYFNSQQNQFSLTYNYLNDTVLGQEYLHVFRNGVYQYYGVDYTVITGSDAKYIEFNSAPSNTDEIFTLNYTTSDLVDVTNRFSQLTPDTLQYTENVSSPIDKTILLIYLNGVLQVSGSWIYDSNTDVLILDENIDISTDKVKIFGFASQKVEVDQFFIQQNVSTYPLLVNGSLISTQSAPLTETDVIVSIAGVLQEPGKNYIINGQNIEIPYQDSILGSSVSVYVIGRNYDLHVLDSFDDNFTKNSFKLQTNFKCENIFGNNNLYVVKNNQVLTTNVDYTSSDGVINFSEPITELDNIEIYVKEYFLTENGSAILLNSLGSPDLLINANGVVQQPEVVYTINSSIITIYNPKILYGSDLNIYQIGDSSVEIIDYLDDNYNKNTFKLSSNYVYYNVNDSGSIFVYKNDQLLENLIDYTYGSGYITFTSSLLETDRLLISPYNYNLIDEFDNNIISTNIPNTEEDLIVNISGVCQKPGDSYSVNGSTITLLNAPNIVNPSDYTSDSVYIYQVGSSSDDVALMDYLDDNYSKPTYKLAINYKSFYPPNIGDIFILRNSVLQNPVEDFIIGNGFITFTTNISQDDDVFIMYTHGAEEISISNITNQIITLGTTINSSEYKNIILNINGAPKFYDVDFTISGNTLTLNEPLPVDPGSVPFVLKYPSITFVDDINDCPDGQRTRFKLLYTFPNGLLTNLVENDIQSDADILISINGIVQYPGVQYTINSIRTFVDFAIAPQETDEIFFVRMSGNEVVNLSLDSGKTYSISSATNNNLDNLVVFSNDKWNFEERGQFVVNTQETKITLDQINTSQYIFGIKFIGIFGLLDQIHTPYNGSIKTFNLFKNEENFVPIGTADNNDFPDETGIIVIKNGKVLDPKVDYLLRGDIQSQILFTTPPISSDVISVRSFGSFLKLSTITTGFTGSNKVFYLKKYKSNQYDFNLLTRGGSTLTVDSTSVDTRTGIVPLTQQQPADYYPNAHIKRPREHENQIFVIVDGNIQNPFYDYYIDNNKLIFNKNIPGSTSKIVIMDFMGTTNDVEVFNRFNQTSPGDQIKLAGESEFRTVTEILSPTILKTQTFTGTASSGFSGTVNYSSGKVTDITVTNGGVRYEHPVVLRTKGSGTSAKATASVNYYEGGVIKDNTVELQYSGYNVYSEQEVLATAYAFTYKQQQLNKSQIRKATKLSSNITSTETVIPLANTTGMLSNSPTVNISALTGSGASFRLYVSSGKIIKIDVLTPGIGYDDRSIKIDVIGGGGTGCVLEPVLDAFGSFTDVIIRNTGIGYDTFRVIVYDPNNTDVDAEFIEYTYVTQNGIEGCTRGSGAESYNQNTIVYFDNYL